MYPCYKEPTNDFLLIVTKAMNNLAGMLKWLRAKKYCETKKKIFNSKYEYILILVSHLLL